MNISSSQFFTVFAHSLQLFHHDLKACIGGLIECCGSCAVLMGGFHHPVHHALGLEVVGVDVNGRGVFTVVKEGSYRFVNQVNQFLFALAQGRCKVSKILGISDHLFRDHASFSMRTGGELMTGAAHTVACGKQAVHRGHTVIDFTVLSFDLVRIRYPVIIRPGSPETATA